MINISMDNELRREQYITLCEILHSNKHLLKSRQRDALVGMQRKLQKGICDDAVCKRIDGLFKYIQNNNKK
jgi:hypothetical protein